MKSSKNSVLPENNNFFPSLTPTFKKHSNSKEINIVVLDEVSQELVRFRFLTQLLFVLNKKKLFESSWWHSHGIICSAVTHNHIKYSWCFWESRCFDITQQVIGNYLFIMHDGADARDLPWNFILHNIYWFPSTCSIPHN